MNHNFSSYFKNTSTLVERTNAANKASTKCHHSKQIFFCCKFLIDALDKRLKLLCWRQGQISKPREPMKGLIWNVSRTNTHWFYIYLFQIYSKKVVENILSTMREFFTKDRIAPEIKQLRFKYRKALELVTQSGAGRPNSPYFIRYLQRNMEKIEMSH